MAQARLHFCALCCPPLLQALGRSPPCPFTERELHWEIRSKLGRWDRAWQVCLELTHCKGDAMFNTHSSITKTGYVFLTPNSFWYFIRKDLL